MKKYLGSFLSFVGGALVYVFFSLNTFVSMTTIGNSTHKEYINGWDLIKDESSNLDGYTIFKIASIVALVLAGLAILSAIILALKNAKVFKSKLNLNFVNQLIMVLLAVALIVSLIALFVMGGALTNSLIKWTPALFAYINTICAVLFATLNFVFVKK